jgi:hypothetical protein
MEWPSYRLGRRFLRQMVLVEQQSVNRCQCKSEVRVTKVRVAHNQGVLGRLLCSALRRTVGGG